MPDSFGKRNRDAVKARKAAERDELRVARNRRRSQRGVTVEPEQDESTNPPVEIAEAGLADVGHGA